MDDYSALIFADGGHWSESEVLGNRAIVKVKAEPGTLSTIASDPSIVKVPLQLLDDKLSSLTANQRTALRNQLLDMGYTADEVTARFPNIAKNTLGDILRFAASRRKKCRYDPQADAIVLDGPDQPCKPIDLLESEIGD
jgi:hypothetical protein